MKSSLLFLAFLLPFFATAQYGYNRPLMNHFQFYSLPQPGDIDGDGDVDVVLTLNFGNELLWFENIDGQGRFSTRKVLKSGINNSSTVQIEDFDLDGDLDIASIILGDDDIALFRNDGTGNFADPEILINDFASDLRTIRSVDLDNDGDMDLVFGDTNETNFFWLENYAGTNSFTDELKLIWDMGPGTIHAYDFGDIDSDGDLDIVAAKVENTGIPNGPVGKIQYYRNQGNGIFDSLKTVKVIDPPVQAGVSFGGMQLGDFNEDGGLDIAILSGYDHSLRWYENNFETWLPIQWDAHNVGSADGVGLFLEDMDSDGDKDFIAVRGSIDKEGYVFENDINSFFWDDHLIMDSENISGICETADFDGDGDLDILTKGDGISWFKNFGNNLYGGKHHIMPGLIATWDAEGLDVDHDDIMDVIFASNAGDEMWYFPGLDGLGKFDEPEQLFESDNIVDFHTNDLNQDGIPDLIYCSAEGDFVSWREGLTTIARFGPEKIIAGSTLTGSPRSVKSPDLNGDGLPDILVASHNDSKISWFRNEGDETFQVTPVVSFDMPWASSVNATDLDNDGDLDILATARQNSEVAIFENTNGLGTFGEKTVILSGGEINEAISADLDNDGNMDIIINDDEHNDGFIYLLRGLPGFNNFAPVDTLADFDNGSTTLEVDDVDDDGDLDVLYGGDIVGIGWIENLGNGQFGEPTQINDYDIQDISLADLDGDEDLDLIYCATGIVQLGYYANVFGEPNATTTQPINAPIAKVYPNPFHQSFTIEILEEAAVHHYQFQLFNTNGQLIRTQKITSQKVEIESAFTKGLLFYQLKNPATGELLDHGKLLGF